MSGERARLFAALELPAVVRAALHQWCSERLDGTPGLRMTAPDSLHVTLCFLGSQPVDQIDAIATACGLVAGRPRPVLALGGPLWLPPRRPRVVAVKLEDRGGGLAALQSSLASGLQLGGWYEPEGRDFRPHVTVARASGKAKVGRLELAAPVPISFVASSVALMRSRPVPGGAQYERVLEVGLAAGGG